MEVWLEVLYSYSFKYLKHSYYLPDRDDLDAIYTYCATLGDCMNMILPVLSKKSVGLIQKLGKCIKMNFDLSNASELIIRHDISNNSIVYQGTISNGV